MIRPQEEPLWGICWLVALIAAAALVVLLSLAGCTPAAAYVDADASTYQTVGAEWIAYVDSDDALDAPAKERRHRKMLSWRARIERAGGDLE